MNLSSKINKLQQALRYCGKIILINRRQVYLKEKNAVVTKYIVTEPVETVVNGEKRVKQISLHDTYSQVDLVKYLAGLIKEVQSG